MKHFGVVIGTHDEIEAQIKNAYEAQGRSDRRQAEVRTVARHFLQGEPVFWWGSQLYVVAEADLGVTPEHIGSILLERFTI